MSFKDEEIKTGTKEGDEKLRNFVTTKGRVFSFLGNSTSIRLESPKTRQACLELGIDPNYFKVRFAKKEKFTVFSVEILKYY